MRWVLGFEAPSLDAARQIVWDHGGLTGEVVTESGLPGFWAVASTDRTWLEVLRDELATAGRRTEIKPEQEDR